MARQFSKSVALALGSVAIFLGGCSSGSDGDSGSVSALGPNIYGQVSQSVTLAVPGAVLQRTQPSAMFAYKPGKTNKLAEFAVNGCALSALDLLSNAELANTTSGTDGTYTLRGLEAGKTYKVIANCGANEKYTSVVKADTSEIADKDPEVTSPVSTIVAAKIIQAVLTAVDSLGLTGDSATAVKAAIVANMDSIISILKSTIETAIQSGAMQPPSVAEAAIIAGGLQTTTTAAQANSSTTAYEIAKPIPATVEQSVEGAKSQVTAFADCESTIAGKSAITCTRAIAKLVYSGLNFPVLLNMTTGGAFEAELAAGCDNNNTGLVALFPAGTFASDDFHGISNFCLIQPTLSKSNRNRGDERGGDDGGMAFAEDMTGGKDGVLTALGQSLFSKAQYRLANIDQIMFSYNSTADAGMNARLFHVSRPNGATGELTNSAFHYKNDAGAWTAVPNIPWGDSSLSYCAVSGCNILPGYATDRHLSFPFMAGAVQWAPSELSSTLGIGRTQISALVTAVGAGSNAGATNLIYGGPVPSMPQIDSFVNEQTHVENNPTGNRKVFAIYSEDIRRGSSSGANPCFDLTSSEPCLGTSGTPYPVVRVNVGLGTTISVDQPTRRIDTVTQSATGAYLMRPFFDRSGFTGIVGFTRVSDGRMLMDELNQERAIKIALFQDDCPTQAILGMSPSCPAGTMINVKLSWNCGEGGSNCPSYNVLSYTPISSSGAPAFGTMITTNYKTTGVYLGSATQPLNVMSSGDFAYMTPLQVIIGVGDTGNDGLTESNAGGHYIVPRYVNCPANCTVENFYLVNENGEVRTTTQDSDGTASSTPVCGIVSGSVNCNVANAVVYTLDQLNDVYFTYGNGNFSEVASNKQIHNGPYVNPSFRCDKEPYFIDGNNNQQLDCDPSNPTNTIASSNDISFSSSHEYTRWYSMPGNNNPLRTAALQGRDNGYVFGDPAGAKKLLTTAFNGWFDGAHTIAADTNLNALQVFGLVFLTFSREGGLNIEKTGTGLAAGSFILQMPSDSEVADSGVDKVVNINNLLGGGLRSLKYTAP